MVPGNKDDDEIVDLESPEIDEVSDPKTNRTSPSPDKHLGRIDPILLEKLTQVEPPAGSPGSQVKYVDGIPVFNRRRETSSFVSTISFLITLIIGFVAVRLFLGEPIVPVAINDIVFGKEEIVIPPPAKVTIDTDLVGYSVTVGGTPYTPFNNQIEVPAGNASLDIVVRRVGYNDFTTKILPTSGTSIVVRPMLTQQQKMGFLSYETVPAAKLSLFLENKLVAELSTPFSGKKIPVGTYRALLENSFIGFRREEMISIEEWKTTIMRLDLQAPNPSAVSIVTPIPANSQNAPAPVISTGQPVQ